MKIISNKLSTLIFLSLLSSTVSASDKFDKELSNPGSTPQQEVLVDKFPDLSDEEITHRKKSAYERGAIKEAMELQDTLVLRMQNAINKNKKELDTTLKNMATLSPSVPPTNYSIGANNRPLGYNTYYQSSFGVNRNPPSVGEYLIRRFNGEKISWVPTRDNIVNGVTDVVLDQIGGEEAINVIKKTGENLIDEGAELLKEKLNDIFEKFDF